MSKHSYIFLFGNILIDNPLSREKGKAVARSMVNCMEETVTIL